MPNDNFDPKKGQQYKLPLIEHQHGGICVSQRAKDGYIDATAMCKTVGKHYYDYARLKATKMFLKALSGKTGIPVLELVQVIKGGNLSGTWVHPHVAINLAQWLSPEFAVEVSEWVFDWLSGGPKTSENMPYHLRRYVANMAKVPNTHFSMLQEMTYNLIAPMEANGYTIPESMLPDISEGRMFCGWLRKNGIEPKNFPSYIHEYEDGRKVKARLYPNEFLSDFRNHFHEVWLPQRAKIYFSERDPSALVYIEILILPKPKAA